MTKTTSYEISKKLKEAGFGKGSAFAHFKSECGGGGIFYVWEGIKGGYEEEFFSYDLETILDALPKQYLVSWYGELGKSQAILRLTIEKDKIFYNHDSDELRNAMYWREKEVQKTGNESLADTAGKMWLMLKEKGLV